MDAFYRENPERLLTQPPEVCVVDADNPSIARRHLNAAAMELGSLSLQEAMIFGARVDEMIAHGVRDQALIERRGRIFGTRRDDKNPHDRYAIQNIRANLQHPYAVCADDGNRCPESTQCHHQTARSQESCKRQLTVIDRQYVYRDCHPEAIYEGPDGNVYKVTAFDDTARSVRVTRLPDDTLERTSVDESTAIEIVGRPQGERQLANGAVIAWGRVRVTRHFEGYKRYNLIPIRRCRRCKMTYDEDVTACKTCKHPTEMAYRQSKAELCAFPAPFTEQGFRIELDTLAAWLTIPTELEGHLNDASPCKLPGDQNGIAQFLRSPLPQGAFPGGLAREEEQLVRSYHRQAQAHARHSPSPDSITLYPGVYGQCLMHTLRAQLPEDRSRRLFRLATGHPADTDPQYVCRGCQTSVLFPALQTLAHTVVKRYPSVALGDQADLGAFATLGHSSTGGPTIFWYDTYEGGIGAAERVFAKIDALLEASQATLVTCTCTTIRGCPNCTQIAGSEQENQAVSKPAASMLIDLLRGQAPTMRFGAFIYPSRQGEAFRQYYADNEQVPGRQTDDAEMDGAAPVQRDPFELLRLQRRHHRSVLEKAFEVRSGEITNDLPRVSAAELQAAYLAAQRTGAVTDWALHPNMTPYEILEVLPDASVNMIRKIYRTIAREVHLDQHRDRREEMNRIMQIVNQAHEDIRQETETSDT
ncbi:MAG: DUF1998 domain-containing protein [Oscillochloris sp.]|nr:DUF1998 domain-containing protein [Oscillochloris sp.]